MLRIPGKTILALTSALLVLLIAAPAFAAGARGSHQPQILGPEIQSKQISVTFWLNEHDKAGFDELVHQQYDRNSSSFHKWITMADFKTKYAPTAADLAVVRQHLATYNLKEVSVDKFNRSITARGSVGDVQRATGVQLNRVMINGEIHRRAESKIAIPGAAGKLIAAVQGLGDTTYKNYVAFPHSKDKSNGLKAFGMNAMPLSKVGPAQKYFNTYCLQTSQTKTFKTDAADPKAVYKGTRYGTNIDNGPPKLPYCGYNAVQVDTAYGLNPLYQAKLDGTGETIVIVDAFGSDTIANDANIFSEINGLPALTAANFQVYYPEGATSCPGGSCSNWNIETTLDVEWAHSIAPGANIALVLALDNTNVNLLGAVNYAITNNLGPVISNSYGAPEIEDDAADLDASNATYQVAASFGISVDVSTGDDGDFSFAIGEPSVSEPADSPYATAVGGTSMFLNTVPKYTIELQTGWGNNETRIADVSPNPPILPPLELGFDYGAGGGASVYFAKPTYQASLPGSYRQLPDIAFLADPFTPVEIVISEGGVPELGTVGGTSLACPMFSALWAITAQAAGKYPGQAAPTLYTLPADAITDILDVNGPANVTGVVHTPHQPDVIESADSLAQPLFSTTNYVSTLFNGSSSRWYVLTFGTDTSLNTAPGWDNVTGLGTPNGVNFVNGVVASLP